MRLLRKQEFTVKLRSGRGMGVLYTYLTREGKGKRAFGEATHNIEILFYWESRASRGSLRDGGSH
jgi:hypothetical protein